MPRPFDRRNLGVASKVAADVAVPPVAESNTIDTTNFIRNPNDQAFNIAMANQQAAQRPAPQPQADVGFATTREYRIPQAEQQQRPFDRSSEPQAPTMIQDLAVTSRPESYLPQQQQPMRMPSMSDMMTNMYGYGMNPFAGRGMGGYGRPMFGGGYGRQPMMPMFGGMGGYGRQPMMPMFGGGYGRQQPMPMFGGGMPVQPRPMPMPATIPMQSPMAPSLAQYAQELYGNLLPERNSLMAF